MTNVALVQKDFPIVGTRRDKN